MAKRPPPGQCIHCLCHAEQMTWDHVFPQSWYPDTTPSDIEKWKVPSCLRCNKEYGQLEADLLVKLGLCLDPTQGPAAGVVQKALRAIDPSSARDERDRRHREARRKRLFREMLVGDAIPDHGRIPGFDSQPGIPRHMQIAFLVPVDDLERLCEKIVRGITYLTTGQVVEPPRTVEVQVLQGDAQRQLEHLLSRHATVHDRGPGIVVQRASADDDQDLSGFTIAIWGLLKFGAFIMKPE